MEENKPGYPYYVQIKAPGVDHQHFIQDELDIAVLAAIFKKITRDAERAAANYDLNKPS